MKQIMFFAVFFLLALSAGVSAQFSLKLDFDNPSQIETEPGYISFTPADYNEITSYGWVDASAVIAQSKFSSENLIHKDNHISPEPATFMVKVPNSYYDVTLHFSNAFGTVKENISISFEGNQRLIGDIWYDSPEVKLFRIPVKDGYLNLKLEQGIHGGGDGWVLGGLEITEISDAPEITSSSSSQLLHGSDFTVYGMNFGYKERGPPLLWDDFETYPVTGEPPYDSQPIYVDDDISQTGYWTWAINDITYSTENNVPGSQGIFTSRHDGNGCDSCEVDRRMDLYYVTDANMENVFFSFYARYGYGVASPNHGTKFWYISAAGTPIGRNGAQFVNSGSSSSNSSDYRLVFKDGCKSFNDNDVNPPAETWFKLEFQTHQSTPVNTPTGLIQIWKSHPGTGSIIEVLKLQDIITTSEYHWQALEIGGFCAPFLDDRCDPDHPDYVNCATLPCGTVEHFDDVYLDNTWARVVLGDAPVYEGCEIREIQIPQTWGGGSITFTANQGTFQNGQTAYIYVVDENGIWNEDGYPVVIGGTGSCALTNAYWSY